ncbi:MAG: helix-turn-helix transcriptional regulator [Eubacteriales bacterium]|nr:helix-turn-helix transcriptional regulator [Eubacteriales bacterium]
MILVYKRFRDLRKDNDLTQNDVASLLNVAQRTYSHYELGTANISVEYLSILAGYYKTSVDYLMGRTDVKKPYPKSSRHFGIIP